MKLYVSHTLWLGALLTLGIFFGAFLTGCQKDDNKPIKIGILHSLTGTMAISEKPVVDATLWLLKKSMPKAACWVEN